MNLGLQQQSTGLPPPYSLGIGQAAGGLQLGASSTLGVTAGGLLGMISLISKRVNVQHIKSLSYDH